MTKSEQAVRAPKYFESAASISECGTYRYWLLRRWESQVPCRTMVVVGLNPSTADATQDDPTIRRCVGFAKREGCGALGMVNLFALRATDPRELARHPDPVGPHNAYVLDDWLASDSLMCVAAWGAHPDALVRGIRLVERYPHLLCFGITKNGAPRHPLYLPATAPLKALRYILAPEHQGEK